MHASEKDQGSEEQQQGSELPGFGGAAAGCTLVRQSQEDDDAR